MTPFTDRAGRDTRRRDVTAQVTLTLQVGTRVATARVQADHADTLTVRVDDTSLFWREISRPALQPMTQRIAAMTPIEVRDTRGRRLMRSVPRRRRTGSRTRWTPRGLATLTRAGWNALIRR